MVRTLSGVSIVVANIPISSHGSGHAAGADEVARLERPKDNQEHAGREVAEHAAPRDADGHAGGGDERREVVVSTPKKPRIAMTRMMFSAIDVAETT